MSNGDFILELARKDNEIEHQSWQIEKLEAENADLRAYKDATKDAIDQAVLGWRGKYLAQKTMYEDAKKQLERASHRVPRWEKAITVAAVSLAVYWVSGAVVLFLHGRG